MAQTTETTYNNYYFFENIIIPVNITKEKSWATSVQDLPKVVNNPDNTDDLITESVKNILQSNSAESDYFQLYNSIISPEENVSLANFEGVFFASKQEIVLNIDMQEAVQDNPWHGKANVTIDVLALRSALEASNKITCKGATPYKKGEGCIHKTPPEATHITYGTFSPTLLENVLKPMYGSDKNIPAFERVTPYISSEDTDKIASFPSTAGTWNNTTVHIGMYSGFLPVGVYLKVSEAPGIAGSKGFQLADILSGKKQGEQILLAPSHIQLMTWASVATLKKEPKPVKQIVESEKIIDLPVIDEPPKAATLHASLGATHIVRLPTKNQKTSTIRDAPGSGRRLGKLQEDTAVQVIEQSLGPGLRYHKIIIADPVVGFDMMGKEAFIKAFHLRPIAAAKADGSWYLLPTADQKDADSRTAGATPLMDKVFEAQDVCAPWVAKDKDAYWNSKYQIVYTEPGTAVGDSQSYVEEHKAKALAQLVEYFDKSRKVDNLAHILALVQHAVIYEDVYRDKTVLKSLVSVPVRFFNALKRNTDPFDYDHEPDLERIRNNASMVKLIDKIIETSSPAEEMRKIVNQSSTLTQPKNTHEAFQKVSENVNLLDPPTVTPLDLNPSVAGEKVAFTSGFYDSELTDGIKKLKRIFKYYDRKLKRSKKTVKFPGFSVPLDMKEEEKKLDEWYSNLKGFLKVNNYDFAQVAPKEKDKPAKYDPKKTWFEFGWNKEFKLLYVLFNGHPLRVGFKCFRMKDAWSLARTNAFIHRSPEILKEYKANGRKKEPWSEWVKKNVYPVALIEPSDLSAASSRKAKLQDALEKSTLTTAKTSEQLVEEEKALQDPEINLEIQSQADKEKIDARDQTFANLPYTIELLKDINDIYDFVVNKLPFQNIILEFTRCIGEDLDADSLVELLIRMALKEIMSDYEKNIKVIEDVFEVFAMAPDCALDILNRSFTLVVEESVPDDDFDPEDFPTPPSYPSPPEPEVAVITNPPSPVATHVVGPDDSIPKKGAPFLKTLPWAGNEAYGLVNVGQTFIFIEDVEVPPDGELYSGASPPPGIEEIKNKQMVKVSIVDKLANLAPGSVGYIESKFLHTLDEALAAQEAEKNQSIILKKGAKDGKKGLTNEVKALEYYLSSAPGQATAGGGEPPAEEIIGKYHGRPLIEKSTPKPKYLNAKLKAAAKLKGTFSWSTKVLVKTLGKQLVKEHQHSGKQVLFSLESAEKMKSSGEITLAAMEKIKNVYAASLSAIAEGQRLEEVEKRLAFNSPEVILGNALFAPPGFYEGKESSCSKKYVDLVNKKREYEIAFIKQGPSGKNTVKLKLQTEKLFGQYKSCLSALGEEAFGNNISHLYGRDISAEEQRAKDGYKIVFAKEQGECKDLKEALRQELAKTGDPDFWPGPQAATKSQRDAYSAWLICVNKQSAEQAKKTLEEERKIIKAGITNATHIVAEYSYPTTIDEAYNLFITQKVMPTGLRPKADAGLSIADAILGLDGPCAELRDTLIDHLVALILREYPEIEMSVRMTLLAYRRSLELYALIRSIDPQNPFGLPKFPKLPTDMTDKAISAKFAEALDKVLEEILFNMMEGLIQALHEICQLINAGKNLTENDLQEATQDVLDNFLNHPESGRLLQDAADKMGLDLVPSVVNNQVILPSRSAGNGQPSLYQFIADILDDLTRTEICSIINESFSRTLLNSVKESIIISYPNHRALLSKDSTIKAIFAGIAAMMPPDFCDTDTGGIDGEDGSIMCLADIIDDRQRKQFMSRGLSTEDVDDLIARKRKRQMDRLVDLAGIIANPEARLKESLPDFCSDVNDTLFGDPGFLAGLDMAIDSNLRLIKGVFNTDVASFTQRLLRTPSVTINHTKLQDNFKQTIGDEDDLLDPVKAAQGQALLQTLEEDPAAFIEDIASMAAEDPDNVDQGAAQMAKYLEVEDAYGIYLEKEDRLMRFKDLDNLPTNIGFIGYTIKSVTNASTGEEEKITIIDLLNEISIPPEDLVPQLPSLTPKFVIPPKYKTGDLPDPHADPPNPGKINEQWQEAMGKIYATSLINSLGSASKHSVIKCKTQESLKRLMDIVFADPEEVEEVIEAYAEAQFVEFGAGASGGSESDRRRAFERLVGYTLTEDGPAGLPRFYNFDYTLDLRAPYETSVRKHKVTDFNSVNKAFGAGPSGLAGSNIIVGELKSALLNTRGSNTIQINDSAMPNEPVRVNLFAPQNLLPRLATAATPMLTFELPQTDQYLDHYKVAVTSAPAQTGRNPERFYVDPATGKMIDATTLPPSAPEYKNPADYPATKTVFPAEKKEYIDSFDLPLYVQNFIDYVSSGEDLSFSGITSQSENKKSNFAPAQFSLFVGFLNKKFDELFPNKPDAMEKLVTNDLSGDYVTSKMARSLYNDMIRNTFTGALRSIGKSKYFLKSELSKLNLDPDPGLVNACSDSDEAPDPSFSLLDIKGIKKYINDAYKNDFNSCDSQDPEALEGIIAEACVLLFIRVTILEAALNGIFAFGTFDLRDLTKDSFIQKYLFDRAKGDLRQVFQYKSFKNTATKILERRRRQYKKFVKIRSPKDSLATLFKEEAKAVMPVYEKILGSTVKEYNDIIFEDIIFPVPVDMSSIFQIGPINLKYDKPIGSGGLTPDIDTGRIRKYFGVGSQIKVDDFNNAAYKQTDVITLPGGKQVGIMNADQITLAEIFEHESGFILEKYVKFKEGSDKALTKAIQTVNEAATDANFLPLPPLGPYVNIGDFFQWLRRLTSNTTNILLTPLGQAAHLEQHLLALKDLLESNWSGFLDSCDFGMRVKYIIASETSIHENPDFGDSIDTNSDITSFKDRVHEYMKDYDSGQTQPRQKVPHAVPPHANAISEEINFDNWNGAMDPVNGNYAFNRVTVRGVTGQESGNKEFYEIPLAEASISLHNMPNITNSTSGDSQPGLGWSTSLTELYDNVKDYKLGGSKSFISPYKNEFGYRFPQADVVYDGFFSSALKKKLQNSGDFKAIFEYMLPLRRIVNASSIFSLETLEKSFNLGNLFNSTKFSVALVHAKMKKAGQEGPGDQAPSGAYDLPATGEFSMEDKIAEIILGFLLKSLAEAPLMIIKGVAEIADPNIAITKKIFDGMDLTVKTAMMFVLDSINLAMKEYNAVARKMNQEAENLAVEADVDAVKLMPVYDTVQDFMTQELGMDPAIDPTVGIPSPIAAGIAPAISLGMLPSMLPYGVGFPPPPFGPGVGPPLTPLGIPYLILGLIKEGGWGYETFDNPKAHNPAQTNNFCSDGSSNEQRPNLEDDDD